LKLSVVYIFQNIDISKTLGLEHAFPLSTAFVFLMIGTFLGVHFCNGVDLCILRFPSKGLSGGSALNFFNLRRKSTLPQMRLADHVGSTSPGQIVKVSNAIFEDVEDIGKRYALT
jgi:hypothetical protein